MNRRTYLVAAGASASALLAGCIDSIGTSEDDDGDPKSGPQETRHGAVRAVEEYAHAVANEDRESLIDAMHSAHPFNPANRDNESSGEWSVEWADADDFEAELRDEDFSTADVGAAPGVELWFREEQLADALDGEEAALVTLTYETAEDGETEETLIALTEDGEWKAFFPYEEPPEIPEGEPVDDLDIVEEVSFDAETETVRVQFGDSIEADIQKVYVYSTSLRQEGWVSGSEDTADFSVNYFTSAFDPAGDEIVVTAVVDDEERVVHRESYEPGE